MTREVSARAEYLQNCSIERGEPWGRFIKLLRLDLSKGVGFLHGAAIGGTVIRTGIGLIDGAVEDRWTQVR